MIDGDNLSVPEMEIETLKSIYLNELDVQRDDCGAISSISIQLYPATADNVEEQYVTMYLSFKIPGEYPESIPEISIHNPRGLLDEQIDRITDNLFEIAENRKGSSMLFELIQAAKEQLTDENRPREDCAICLYGFFDEDIFMKTECYHYFHSHCLSRYIQCKIEAQEKEEAEQKTAEQSESTSSNHVSCPVCRVPLSVDLAGKEFPEPVGVSGAVVDIDSSILDKQEEMNKIYKKQLEQGGIIDIEAESKKYLLEISNVPDDPVEETAGTKVPVHQSNASKESGPAVNGTESGARQRVSPHTIPNRATASNSQPRSAKNRRGKYVPRGRISDWTEYGEDSNQTDGNTLEESDSQKPEHGSPAPRARRNYQNPRQNEQFQRAPRFGGGKDGDYRNDNRYPRNNAYRRGNNNRGSRPYNNRGSRPYNRRSQPNDADSVPVESEFNPNGAAHIEDRSSPNLSDVEDAKKATKSSETRRRRKNSPQDRGSSSDEQVNSGPAHNQRTLHSSTSRDWSSRESPEKPSFQRYQKRDNYKPKPQYSNERGRGRRNQNFRDESRESAPLSPEAVSNSDQNDKSQRFLGNRGGYRNNGGYDNKQQYGDKRRNPNWQPRHNDRGQRYSNYRNDAPRRGSYRDRNSRIPPTNSASVEDRQSEISNGSCSSHVDNLPKDIQVQRDLSSVNVDSRSAETTFKVPHIENSAQDIELKNSSCAVGINVLQSPPGFANPHKKVIYGLPSVNPPPGFHQS